MRNPSFGDFTDGVVQNDKARIAFILAATCPDIIKRDPEYHNDGSHNGDVPPPGPDAARNIGYADKLRHKYWHFVDTPFSPDGRTSGIAVHCLVGRAGSMPAQCLTIPLMFWLSSGCPLLRVVAT